MSGKPPFPPFTLETARQKARMAENAWNSKDADKVSLAYTEDSVWRNRSEFIQGRAEILAFLQRKWAKELDYKLIKEVWACSDNRIAVRFQYEWRNAESQWFRAHGNENWEFAENGSTLLLTNSRRGPRGVEQSRKREHSGWKRNSSAARVSNYQC